MPLYEYSCDACGPFSAWRPMAESSSPTACAACGASAERILSASSVNRRGGGRRGRGVVEPRLVKRRDEDVARAAAASADHGHGGGHGHGEAARPWMIGH